MVGSIRTRSKWKGVYKNNKVNGQECTDKKYIWEEVYKDKKYMESVYQDKKYMGSVYKEESIWEVYAKKKVYGKCI